VEGTKKKKGMTMQFIFKKLIVLDYNRGNVHTYNVNSALLTEEKIENLLKSLGFNLDEVSYMYSDDEMEIINHTGFITDIDNVD